MFVNIKNIKLVTKITSQKYMPKSLLKFARIIDYVCRFQQCLES